MPGYVMHLAVAESIIKKCSITDAGFVNDFLIGSIIPDIKKGNEKRKSHFWTEEEFKKFARMPDIDLFMMKYADRVSEPFMFGYYSHLYMDHAFIEKYWNNHFTFYDKDMAETNLYQQVAWVQSDASELVSRERFFSDELYYGDYNRMNEYMLRHYNIRIPELRLAHMDDKLPDEIRTEEAEEPLRKMIDFLKRTHEQITPGPLTEDMVQSALKVFHLREMEKLIEDTAGQLSGRYNTICCDS